MNMNSKRWLISMAVVVVVAVGVGAFFGGKAAGGGTPSPAEAMKVVSNLTAAQRQALAQSSGGTGAAAGAPTGAATGAPTGAGFPGAAGGNMTSGSIVSSDANSMTIKLASGSTKIVLYSGSTTISVSKTGSSADFTAGQNVRVSGTTNSDGSITATNIQCGTVAAAPDAAPPAAGDAPGDTTGTTSTTGTGASSGTSTDSATSTPGATNTQ